MNSTGNQRASQPHLLPPLSVGAAPLELAHRRIIMNKPLTSLQGKERRKKGAKKKERNRRELARDEERSLVEISFVLRNNSVPHAQQLIRLDRFLAGSSCHQLKPFYSFFCPGH